MNRSRDNDILTENCVNYSFLYFSWWRAFLRLVYFCPWNHSSMPFFISLPLNNSFKYLTDLLKTHSVTYNKIITIKVAILVIVWWKTCFNYAFQGYSGFFSVVFMHFDDLQEEPRIIIRLLLCSLSQKKG